MAQYKKSGEPRQITKYELRFKDGRKTGVYYINFSRKEEALAKARRFRKSFKGVTWTVHKIKRNVWIKKR